MRPLPRLLPVLLVLGCGDGALPDDPLAADEAALVACLPTPPCDARPPTVARRAFHGVGAWLLATFNAPKHRGRDALVVAGAPQWIVATIAYGPLDLPLEHEDVDVHVLRGCGDTWEHLGTARTTRGGEAAPVEGVEARGGRVYFRVPAERTLELGRHRVRLVVAGDLSATELVVEVVAEGQPFFVSDIDGTLTSSEIEEVLASLGGRVANANPGAAAQLQTLVDKGYRPFYLTARPEGLTERTREFLARRGFPPGTIHTTTGGTGALGDAAVAFKTGELDRLAAQGLVPSFAFGNTDTDAEAYDAAMIDLDGRIFFRHTDAAHGGRRIDAYAELAGELAALPMACE